MDSWCGIPACALVGDCWDGDHSCQSQKYTANDSQWKSGTLWHRPAAQHNVHDVPATLGCRHRLGDAPRVVQSDNAAKRHGYSEKNGGVSRKVKL